MSETHESAQQTVFIWARLGGGKSGRAAQFRPTRSTTVDVGKGAVGLMQISGEGYVANRMQFLRDPRPADLDLAADVVEDDSYATH